MDVFTGIDPDVDKDIELDHILPVYRGGKNEIMRKNSINLKKIVIPFGMNGFHAPIL